MPIPAKTINARTNLTLSDTITLTGKRSDVTFSLVMLPSIKDIILKDNGIKNIVSTPTSRLVREILMETGVPNTLRIPSPPRSTPPSWNTSSILIFQRSSRSDILKPFRRTLEYGTCDKTGPVLTCAIIIIHESHLQPTKAKPEKLAHVWSGITRVHAISLGSTEFLNKTDTQTGSVKLVSCGLNTTTITSTGPVISYLSLSSAHSTVYFQ